MEDDWPQVKALRLEMLADTPLAYLETLDSARDHADDFWRRRAAGGWGEQGINLVAIAADGRWLGTMACRIFDGAVEPYLVGVYVAPAARGAAAGVTDALLTAIEEWASTMASGLLLDVHEDNAAARRAYAKRGFVETGRTIPYPLDPRSRELQMRKSLR
ncbi:MAG: family N-acetyltransferase [Naasia sp.]|nr:family N-acetyltransferase [Naasia sp.]